MADVTEYTRLSLGSKLDYGFDLASLGWLGADTISSSTWTVSPVTGLTITGQTNTTTATSVFAEAITAGTYRLSNAVITTAGRKITLVVVVSVEAATLAGAYLSPNDAEGRLWARYGIEVELVPGDVEAASESLDRLGPFIGTKQISDQDRAFPRSVTPDGEEAGVDVPGAVLDAVALLALNLQDDTTPVQSEGAGGVSVTYAVPKVSVNARRVENLLEPYLLKIGTRR